MWMTSYINEIKRRFRDIYGFKPIPHNYEMVFDNQIPDGIYPMVIEVKKLIM